MPVQQSAQMPLEASPGEMRLKRSYYTLVGSIDALGALERLRSPTNSLAQGPNQEPQPFIALSPIKRIDNKAFLSLLAWLIVVIDIYIAAAALRATGAVRTGLKALSALLALYSNGFGFHFHQPNQKILFLAVNGKMFLE